MLEEGINFVDLVKLLNEQGYDYTETGVRQKISRGRFDFAFGLQVIEVLGYKLNLQKS